jgi:hypothetical protein
MRVTKEHVLSEVQRTATENGGQPLGRGAFFTATGIRESDWIGKWWPRWNDVLVEAGFPPNQMNPRRPDDDMLQHLADLVRELGHYPVIAELKMKARADKTFPSPKTFDRFGGKRGVAARLQAFALERGLDDVAALCAPFMATGEEGDTATMTAAEAAPVGVVYLVKSGRFYKVGRSNAVGRRQYELAIQLPEKATLVHSITTDDPPGIEGYWHRRFADRRRNGEWFELTTEDVSAFRRRKFM